MSIPKVDGLPQSRARGQFGTQHRFVPFPPFRRGLFNPFPGQQITLFSVPPFDTRARRNVHSTEALFNGATYGLILEIRVINRSKVIRYLLQNGREESRGLNDPVFSVLPFPYEVGDPVIVNARFLGARETGTIKAIDGDTFTVTLDSGGDQDFDISDILISATIPAPRDQIQANGNVQ